MSKRIQNLPRGTNNDTKTVIGVSTLNLETSDEAQDSPQEAKSDPRSAKIASKSAMIVSKTSKMCPKEAKMAQGSPRELQDGQEGDLGEQDGAQDEPTQPKKAPRLIQNFTKRGPGATH